MAEPRTNESMERIVALCKRRGFIFQSSEIYGGINGFWDYGPLGAELKRNVKDLWWRRMTRERDDVVGLDATIIMHRRVWEASGHASAFSDPMVDCLLTKKRFRADQIEAQAGLVYHYSGAKPGEMIPRAELSKLDAELRSLLAQYPPEPRQRAEQLFSVTFHAAETCLAGLRSVAVGLAGDPEIPKPVQQLIGEFVRKFERASNEAYAVLMPPEKHPEFARKIARKFYESRGVNDPQLEGERTEKIDTAHALARRFNPENGGLLTEPRAFNLMFRTHVGPVEEAESLAYLRPETAQAIFAQFKTVFEVARQKVPFGIAQIGKAFRNEINPRNFTFRSREFEQMELEFFIRPDEVVEAICGQVATAAEVGNAENRTRNCEAGIEDPRASALTPQPNWGWEAWHKYWVEERIAFYESIGLRRDALVEYWQKPEELAHYARATVDILYRFPFSKRDEQGALVGEELEGIAARGDFDLSQHARFSGKSMGVFDDELRAAWAKLGEAKKKQLCERYHDARLRYLLKMGAPPEQARREAQADADGLAKGQYVPHVIEPSAGVDRLVLALICAAYAEDRAPDENGELETRVVMRFHPRIAPIKVAVFPLLRNKPALVSKARQVWNLLRPHLSTFYDDAGAIGRRYRRQDEAGTPFGVTIDFETLGEKGPALRDTVTLRDRDTMRQERVEIAELLPWLLGKTR